jgi:hypothetical protein
MRTLSIILFLFITSCSPNETTPTNQASETDSILAKSQSIISEATTISEKSDSVTQRDVTRIVYKIKVLRDTVKAYQIERSVILNKLKTTKEIVRIDTVYIEKKKNFWGKEKTNVTVKSDSSVVETADSTSVNKDLNKK